MKKNLNGLNKRGLLLAIAAVLTIQTFATPPRPPFGKRWVLNILYSDEFNGTTLNADKWYDYHPTWKGRAPGLFMSSQVNVEDGYLKIWGEKMTKDTIVNGTTFNIKCGAVVSKKQTAHYGYYECKFKANATTLSSTFWFSNRTKFAGPKGCDKYSEEWDVQECIGRGGNFNAATNMNFHKGMHSNGHYWYTSCPGETDPAYQTDDYRAPVSVSFTNTTELASENYNVYGGWWKDSKSASYYYNNTLIGSHDFYNQIDASPFDEPMGMNLVVETYPFPWVELPNDAELADPTKNTTYYDWVRAYNLVDVNDPNIIEEPKIVTNGDFETGNLTGWVGWGTPGANITSDAANVYAGNYSVHILGAGAPEQNITVKANTDYKLTCYAKASSGSISLGIKSNSGGNTLKSIEVASTDYQEYSFTFNSGTYSDLKFYFYAAAGEEGYADNFEIVELNTTPVVPEVIAIFDEKVILDKNLSALPSAKTLTIPFDFMTNQDRRIHATLKDPEGVLVKDTTFTVYAGYGVTQLNFKLQSAPAAKNGYKLVADLVELNTETVVMTDQIDLDITFATAFDPIKEKANKGYVYPNPVSSVLYVNGIDADIPYQILTITGSVIKAGTTQGNSIAVNNLNAGTYVLEVNRGHYLFFRN